LIPVHVSRAIHTFFALFNLSLCTIFVCIRVYHQRKWKTEQPKLSLTGLGCMVAALVCCCALVNTQVEFYFGDKRYCDLSMKLPAGMYTLHRILLYIFVILRLEVVNQTNFVATRIIRFAKVFIGAAGIFLVVASIVFSRGVNDGVYDCAYEVNFGIVVVAFAFDTIICVAATWMFIQPLRNTLRNLESVSLSYMLKKTKFWSIVCFVSTMLTMISFAILDGAGWMAGFDCSVTSFALLMMMSPVKDSVRTWSSKKANVEAVEITSGSVGGRNPSCGYQPSSNRRNQCNGSPVDSSESPLDKGIPELVLSLNDMERWVIKKSQEEKEIDAVLSEDIFQQVWLQHTI